MRTHNTFCARVVQALAFALAALVLMAPAHADFYGKVGTNTDSVLRDSPDALCATVAEYWATQANSCRTATIVGGCPAWADLDTWRTIAVDYPNAQGQCPGTVSSYSQSWTLHCPANSTRVAGGLCRCNAGWVENDRSCVTAPPPPPPPDGTTTTRYEYTPQGQVARVIDPRSQVVDLRYDRLQRLIRTEQPAPTSGANRPTIGFEYDGLDQLLKVTDPRNLATTYSVTGLGDTTSQASPDTGTTGMTFDAAGHLKTRLDARGKTVTYSYDAANRLVSIDYPTGTDTAFTYGGPTAAAGARGRLTRITDESGQTDYAYDLWGRLTQKTQAVGTPAKTFTVGYGYGSTGPSTGKLTTLTYPSGNRIGYTHDAAGKVVGLTLTPPSGPATPLLSAIVYAPFGPPLSWVWGNTSIYTRSLDLDGRLASYPLGDLGTTTGPAAGTRRSLAYDPASRITAFTHKNGAGTDQPSLNHSFSYDDLNRLTGWTQGSLTHGYTYDATGNRSTFYAGAAYTHTIAATSNRLMATSGPAPAKTNQYDPAGNLTHDGSIAYGYSDRGRMASSTRAGQTTTYLYNALEQRVRKSGPSALIPSGTHYYVYDEAGHLLGEYDANGQALQETVYLGDLPVAVLKPTSATPPPGPAPTPIVIDNTDTPSVTIVGTWAVSTYSPGYEGTNYRAREAGSGTDSFTWRWTAPTTGTHTLYAKWSNATTPNRATNAAFTVTHAGGTATVTKNQNLDGGSWQLLGTYSFTAGTQYSIKLSQNPGGFVIADAVQIVPPVTSTPPPAPESPSAITVDNTDTPSVTVVGTWAVSTYSPGYEGINYRAREAGTGTDSFTWRWSAPTTGTHAVYAKWSSATTPNRATSAAFAITHAGGTATVTKNQNLDGGSWQLLGTYGFTAGTQYSVKLSQNTGGFVIADAVRIVPEGQAGVGSGAGVHYVYADQINTPRTITRATDNKIVWTWSNPDPFGLIQPNENPNALGSFQYNPRFPGQVRDSETGLYYNWHRYYDPQLGRYIQSDPLGLDDGPNTYAYVGANPNAYIDPSGRFGIVGAIGGATMSVISQMAICAGLGGDLATCLKCINMVDVAANAVVGFVMPTWLGNVAKPALTLAKRRKALTGLGGPGLGGVPAIALRDNIHGAATGTAAATAIKAMSPSYQYECDDVCERYRLGAGVSAFASSIF